MPAHDERSLLAERDEGEGVPFSTVPFVVTKATDGPRPMLMDRQLRGVIGRLKADGLVEERAVVGEEVVFALTPRGQQKAGRRAAKATATPQTAAEPAARTPFWLASVVVPAVVAALTVLILRVVGV
ncbi:MAG: hypothetical protein GC186_18785 [Rhodobacteraceae bacterium]|nr:hypothetical protein [Paracoccaceae bacterium]